MRTDGGREKVEGKTKDVVAVGDMCVVGARGAFAKMNCRDRRRKGKGRRQNEE